MPTLSIILPNRNHAQELGVSLPAIFEQSRPADEVVVIDDASTDRSLEIIERLGGARPGLRLLRNERQRGVAESVRRGLKAATGDYVLLASADERLAETACETLMSVMSEHPGAKLAVSTYAQWYPDEDRVRVHDAASEHGMWYVSGDTPEFISPERLRGLIRRRFVWLPINTAIFRRDALLEVGGLDPALRWHSDWFAIYAVALRYGFCAVPRSLAWFRMDPSSYSITGMRDGTAQREVAMAIQRKLREPRFRDVDAAVMDAPVAMSTFMRATLLALAVRPSWYPRLARLLAWWLGEVAKGRRPAAWARILDDLRTRLRGAWPDEVDRP